MTLFLQAASVAYAHGGNRIFADVSLAVRDGDRLAPPGANGPGKRAPFRVLARRIAPDAGAVARTRGLSVGCLSHESAIDPALTIRDAVALAAGGPAGSNSRPVSPKPGWRPSSTSPGWSRPAPQTGGLRRA